MAKSKTSNQALKALISEYEIMIAEADRLIKANDLFFKENEKLKAMFIEYDLPRIEKAKKNFERCGFCYELHHDDDLTDTYINLNNAKICIKCKQDLKKCAWCGEYVDKAEILVYDKSKRLYYHKNCH